MCCRMYQSWGGVLLGLGLCVLLICLILCIHAYCVMAANAAASGETEDNDAQPPSLGSTEAKTNPVRSPSYRRRCNVM